MQPADIVVGGVYRTQDYPSQPIFDRKVERIYTSTLGGAERQETFVVSRTVKLGKSQCLTLATFAKRAKERIA